MAWSKSEAPSAAFFNPQSKAADVGYLDSLQRYLHGYEQLSPFVEAIKALPQVWKSLASHNCQITASNQGQLSAQALAKWIDTSDSSTIANGMSGSLTLPLLTIIQMSQYFQFLQVKDVKHHELLRLLGRGGVHGYCGGLLPAVAVAVSANEGELVRNASKALHLALVIGIYGDLGDNDIPGATTNMVVRLKHSGQGEKIVQNYPGAYISAVTDPKTISIVGPAHVLEQIKAFTKSQGLLSQGVHIRGKVHNPENKLLAADLARFCKANDGFRFPDATHLQVPLRSNMDGNRLLSQCLTLEVIETILSTRCEWYRLLNNVAADLGKSDCQSHYLVNFGIGDCLSPVPFHQHGLTIIKSEARSIIKEVTIKLQSGQTAAQEYPSNAIAVVGMACRLPGANDVEELWDLLSSGCSTVEELPRDRVDIERNSRILQDQSTASKNVFYANLVDRHDAFDNEFFAIKPREATHMDPQQRLLLETSYQALESSGYLRTHRRDDGDDVGIFLGASFVEYLANTSSHQPTAYNSVGTLRAFLCGRISYHFGWTGPGEVIDTACSSSLVAVNRACKAIQSGECSMALAGGVNVISSIDNFLDLGKAGFLSPTGQCKPFDEDADGYCRSEGVGLVLLKPLSQALRDGDRINGVICGAATNQGGLSSSITVPHAPSQVRLFRNILEQARIPPHKVSYVEAHGTGTQAGDPLEVSSIREVFCGPQRETPLHIGSIKGNIGHCETAAGIAGCIKALLLIQKGEIPPLASHKNLNPKISNFERDRMAIASHPQPWETPFRVACVNSYGAAGSNAAVLFCQPPAQPAIDLAKNKNGKETLPFLLSADSEFSLSTWMKDLKTYLQKPDVKMSSADVAFTLAEKRQHFQFRWTTVARDLTDVSRALNAGTREISRIPSNARGIVLVFCGQVSRYVGMKRRLYESCGLLRRHLDQCDQLIQSRGLRSLFPAIFQTEPISDIKVLHCCLFSYQYASALSWIESGLRVDSVVGQSFGELTALAVAGILSLENALDLVSNRASLIESHWGAQGGTMLAVRCDIETAKQLVVETGERGKDVEIACYNAQDSYVLGGTADAIATTEKIINGGTKYSSVKASRLDVTHAYHTKLSDSILDDLDSLARSMEFRTPSILLETCTHKRSDILSPEHIRKHMRSPVYFQDAIRRLEERFGDCVWLEAGSDSPTFALVKRAVVSPKRHQFYAMKISDGKTPMQAISEVTASLWNLGVPVSYWNFHGPREHRPQQVWLPPYHFQETRHWLPYVDRTIEAMEGRILSDESQNQSKKGEEDKSFQLVEKSKRSTNDHEITFKINASHPRFHEIVTGHAVLGRPLCPAGMYLECVILAAQQAAGTESSLGFRFKDCSFESPLGTSPDRDISIQLLRSQGEANWSFEISSSARDPRSAKSVVHAKGYIALVHDVQMEQYQRLISRRMEELQNSTDLDMLRKDKAYRLFSRVVDYSEIFQGISAIKFAGSEAVAKLTLKADNAAVKVCSAISLDNYLQVCGLLVNSHKICPADCAYLAVGTDSIHISQPRDVATSFSYTVYTTFESSNGSKAVGDIFVLDADSQVVAVMTGVQFQSVPLRTLSKMLDASNEGPKVGIEEPDIEPPKTTPSTTRGPGPSSPTFSTAIEGKNSNAMLFNRLKDLLSQHSGCPVSKITEEATIEGLGIDSLAKIELKADIEVAFSQVIDDNTLSSDNTVRDLLGQLGIQDGSSSLDATAELPEKRKQASLDADPTLVIAQNDASFPASAEKHGFSGFWDSLGPKLDELVLVYISEAFERLGTNLSRFVDGDKVPTFKYLPKHVQLVERLWLILERFEIVSRSSGQYVRTSKPIPMLHSSDLQSSLASSYPNHAMDLALLAITGPELANCLSGTADPLKLLFGNPRAQQVLGDFYHKSPMFATMTDQLLLFVKIIVTAANVEAVRILEVGAGFGGTTTLLAEMLHDCGCSVQYTFTDLARTLVDKARKAFSKYPWMGFETLDLEQDPPVEFQGAFDIVIATNVVHATSDLVASSRRMRSLLRDGGFICLSEITEGIHWYDLVFGLLPGWWCFKDGREYALQSAEEWMATFKQAGFESTACSTGPSREARSQRLLIGSTRALAADTALSSPGKPKVQTVVYKSVANVDIHADIYLPESLSSAGCMPIALMIHGGGFMTLSKSAIRPAQTRFLLAHGILPISLDHRLCPEINLTDGPMSDIRDAVSWARSTLPSIALKHNITVNPEKIAVIGWSTGGHLAMTTAWTTTNAGIPPPTAILNFYGPSDMEALASNKSLGQALPPRTMPMQTIRSLLPANPITTHGHSDSTNLGWLKPGDPRSELVLSLFQESGHRSLSILLNGLPEEQNETFDGMNSSESAAAAPDPLISKQQLDSINPIAQVRAGKYTTPTFIVHGSEDEVLPCGMSVAFVEALREKGVEAGVRVVDGAKHLCDLGVEAGSLGWEGMGGGEGYAWRLEQLGVWKE
ncbi:MAG: hypothetical protein Q9216_002433 [Gyalolechia sp. 2 TL-2023]